MTARFWKCPRCGPNVSPYEIIQPERPSGGFTGEAFHDKCGQPVDWRYYPWPEAGLTPGDDATEGER